MTDLFYGPAGDGRSETDRELREAYCKGICATCIYRVPCLEKALVYQETHGVWGGMGEGDRKSFRRWLREEGYKEGEVPKGDELIASLRAYTNDYMNRKMA